MHHVHEFFFPDRSTARGLLARCDVRVRLILALASIVAVVMSTRIWFGLAAFACCLIGMGVGKGVRTVFRVQDSRQSRKNSSDPFFRVVARLAAPMALAVVLCLARMFTTNGEPLATFDLGPWQFTATREGLFGGLLIASRVLGSLGIVMALCHGVPAHELFAALRWAKVPRTWLEIAVLMYRHLFVFFEQAVSVIAAQWVRLGYSTLRRSLHSMGSLAGLVVLRSLDQTEKSHEAMLARGYHGFLPLPSLPALSKGQAAVAVGGAALVAIACFLAERWPQ